MEQQRFRNRNTTVIYHLRTNQESRYAMKWYYEKKRKNRLLGWHVWAKRTNLDEGECLNKG